MRVHTPVIALAALLLAPHVGMAQAPGGTFRLVAVHVSGGHRYGDRDVAAFGGLTIDQSMTAVELDAAARRVAATGLFSGVKYHYSTTGPALTAEFEVEEAPLAVPIVFDNFVWMTDAELAAAVRAAIPDFDGRGPDNTTFVAYMATVLQHVLDARGVHGRVAFVPQLNLSDGSRAFGYVVGGAADLRVCRVAIPGATALSADAILAAGDPLVGREYSRSFVTALSHGTWLDLYHHDGRWKAAFAAPTTSVNAGCGVVVTIPVTEGPSYEWSAAAWTGVSALTTNELDSALGMTAGHVADGANLDAGLRRVTNLYASHGYLQAAAVPTPELDDAAKRAVFHIAVAEGPQFKMGILAFSGVPDKVAADLTRKWKLHSGDPFDASYPGRFQHDEILPLEGRGTLPSTVVTTFARQADRLFVDVRVGPP